MRIGTLALLMAIITAPACGGGGADSGVGPSPIPLLAGFVAEQPTPGLKTVSMLQASKTNDVVSVYVFLTDIQAAYGIAFEVDFDTAGAVFLGYTRGTAFEANGGAPAYTVDGATNPGRVVVGVARTSGTTTNIIGSKAVLVLQFRVKQIGDFPVFLQNGVVYDGQVPPAPMSSIQWFAGALTGV